MKLKIIIFLFLGFLLSCSSQNSEIPKRLYLSVMEELTPEFKQKIVNSISELNQSAGYEVVSLSDRSSDQNWKPLIIYKTYSNEIFAHAEYRDYRCLIKIDETQPSSQNDLDLKYILLHEIGHCYGFSHSNDEISVMYPAYSGTINGTELLKNNTIQKINDFLSQIKMIL